MKKNNLKVQKKETGKDKASRSVCESGVILCQYCVRSFVRQQCWCAHEEGCVEKLVNRVIKRKTAVLRPAVELAQDQVHSDASLSIGQGNVFRVKRTRTCTSPSLSSSFQYREMCLLSRKVGRVKG